MSPAARPSLAELRAVAQPPAVLSRANAEHWAGLAYGRKISIHITRALVNTRITPDGITWGMIVAGGLSAISLSFPRALDGGAGGAADPGPADPRLLRRRTGPLAAEDRGQWGLPGPHRALRDRGRADRRAGNPGRRRLGLAERLGHGGLRDRHRHPPREGRDGSGAHRAGPGEAATDRRRRADHPGRGVARRPGGVRRWVPIHRALLALEFSFIAMLAAVGDSIFGTHNCTKGLCAAMLPIAIFVAGGHLLAILLSNRLRPPAPEPAVAP